MNRAMVVAGLCLLASGTTVHADAIDGDWCNAEGRHLAIDGPAIVIPSGTAMQGDYGRHAFRYVGPPGDPEAGQTVEMRLLNEDEMQLRRTIEGVAQPVETWKRCQTVS